jgi:hypothetical protein
MGALQLSKVVPKHTHVQRFTWVKRGFMLFSFYSKRKGKVQTNCFWCKRAFTDDENMALAGRQGKVNTLLCDPCAIKAAPSSEPSSLTFGD